MTSDTEIPSTSESSEHRGAEHAQLKGGTGRFFFRPDRLSRSEFGDGLTCRLQWNGQPVTTHAVLNLSRWGFAFGPEPGPTPMPGAEINTVELLHRGDPVWSGRGTVAYTEDQPLRRIGVRLFGDAEVDLDSLRLREGVVEALLAQHEKAAALPVKWLAAVGMVAHLLNLVRGAAEAAESAMRRDDSWRDQEQSRRAVASLYQRWSPVFAQRCLDLEQMSRRFTPAQVSIGHDYAQRALMPLLLPCPMHRRAFEKPLGYAGDYRLMELIQEPELEGDSLYARFLHHVGRQYTLAETVRRRGEVAAAAIRKVMMQDRPVRIASLACGPAIELQRVFADLPTRKHPIELAMIDQDQVALGRCNQKLTNQIKSRPDSHLIEVKSMHFSIRQMVLPKPGGEQDFVKSELHSFDFVYSMGLYDYILQPLARRITSALWRMLKPGGRMLIGNLVREPDSSWMMEYATEWNLIYRTRPEMLDLAAELDPAPQRKPIVRSDATRRCLFLDATRD